LHNFIILNLQNSINLAPANWAYVIYPEPLFDTSIVEVMPNIYSI